MLLLGWLVLLSALCCVCPDEITLLNQHVDSTDIAKETDVRLLVFSTLDGHLYGVDQKTGNVKWKIKEKPVVQVPKASSDAIIPLFLPDPRDGSLYLIGKSKEQLKKLPFTIPELVSSSPCRSSDGILFTGKKKDTWFTLDPKTGRKHHILGWDRNSGPTCPVQSAEAIYVGRAEYSIMMVDMKHANRRWNVTYYDYSAELMDKNNHYEYMHLASSSTGLIVSVDKRTASIVWDINLDSPIVSAYIVGAEGLISLPFNSLSNHTLSLLSAQIINNEKLNNLNLYKTLYIGEHSSGLYALSSFIDKSLVTISNLEGRPLLLEGPTEAGRNYVMFPIAGANYPMPILDDLALQSVPMHTVVYLGHYDVPDYTKTNLQIAGSARKLITDESDGERWRKDTTGAISVGGVEQSYIEFRIGGVIFATIVFLGCTLYYFKKLYTISKYQQPSTGMTSTGSNRSSVIDDFLEGPMTIGTISFDPEQLLGKGCEGTFVYRGEFDGRQVAVKRILPHCFDFAEREVALLRESDAHPNVVRYFCTENDRMFKYIALELCQATLCDYVEGDILKDAISALDILQQATAGLSHLHSLKIVHRDIKPQNVLISMPGTGGSVRAMISDFGLCKKLQVGRKSLSRRSGLAGTEGWIAPEILHKNYSATRAVDMFSLGCLYYYVLSEGEHPFGDVLRRQANILNGEWTLDKFKGTPDQVEIYKPLVTALISTLPEDRPSCRAVLAYPIFWSATIMLTFLQDVSDRVEKAELSDPTLLKLEHKGNIVVRGDWRIHIDEEVATDLRKYRNYKGFSLRDLLRALRNKKHHYQELTENARAALGRIPDDFVRYWTSRFPLLLVHTYLAMQVLSSEDGFGQYYDCGDYTYSEHLLDYSVYEHEANTVDLTMLNDARNDLIVKTGKRKSYTKYKGDEQAKGLYRNNGELTRRKPKNNDAPLRWVLPQTLKDN